MGDIDKEQAAMVDIVTGLVERCGECNPECPISRIKKANPEDRLKLTRDTVLKRITDCCSEGSKPFNIIMDMTENDPDITEEEYDLYVATFKKLKKP